MSIYKKISKTWKRTVTKLRNGNYGLSFLMRMTNHWRTRLLAVFIAFGCWAFVQLWSKTPTTITVPINFITSENYEAVARTTNGLPIQNLTIKILRSWRDKNALRDTDYKSSIDLTEESENVIPSYTIKPNENIKYVGPAANENLFVIESIQPAKIRLIIDKKISKNVPVEPTVIGKPASGYQITTKTVNPAAVNIIGPERSINKIELLHTVPINIDGLNKSLKDQFDIEKVDPSIKLNDTKVEVNIGINIVPKQREFDSITVRKLVSLPTEANFTLSPPKIKVILKGREQLIETTVPNDITAYVDLAGATVGYDLLIKVIPPGNCNVVSVMPATVTVK